jgi:ribosomal-protein-alanine N-acetyltransferase
MSSIYDLFAWWPQTSVPVVERAGRSDCDAFAAIHAASFHRGWGAEDIDAMLADRAIVAHVVRRRQGGAVAGFILSRVVGDEAEILTVCVAPRVRGRGFGARLLAAHVPDLMRAGVRQLFLEVEAGNEAAIKLYTRQGFEEIGRRKGYYRSAAGTADAVTMRRDLPAI